MNQRNIRDNASLTFFLIMALGIFAGACTVGSDAANEKANNSSTPTPEANTAQRADGKLLTGEAAKGDWTTDAPGVRRKLTAADMPTPYATESVRNQPKIVTQPEGAMPQVPAGFKV